MLFKLIEAHFCSACLQLAEFFTSTVMLLKLSILVSLVIVSQLLFKSGLSLDEKSSLHPLDQDLNAQLWKRFPCIVGTRYRTQRCRRRQGKRGLGRTKNLRYWNVFKEFSYSMHDKIFSQIVCDRATNWPVMLKDQAILLRLVKVTVIIKMF